MSINYLKTFTNTDYECDEGKREVVSIINTDTVDRDGEIVLPKGINLSEYSSKNEIVLFNHDRKSPPIGKNLWIKSYNGGKELRAKTVIAPADATPYNADFFKLIQGGFLNTTSIGFTASRSDVTAPTTKELSDNPKWQGASKIIRAWKLLEYSFVTLPANPDAINLAVSKGLNKETITFLKGKLEAQEAAKIVAAVAQQKEFPRIKEESDLSRRIKEEADKITLNINIDSVIRKALASMRQGNQG